MPAADRLDLARRRLRPELMDDPALDPAAHRQALRGLARLNRASRAAAPIWRGIRTLVDADRGAPLRVLDIACGGGDVSRGIARAARRAGVDLTVHGVDISPTANRHAAGQPGDEGRVTFGTADVLNDPLPAGFDVVCCSLFIHHLQDDQIVRLLQGMTAAAARGIVISDLRRSITGYLLAQASTRLLSRSPIVWTDGPRSVEGALTPEEFRRLAERAGLSGIEVRRAWPQRYLAVWRKPQHDATA